MVNKQHIENFLRLNGIPTTASDKDVRAALRSAKWHDQDVESAIIILKGDKPPYEVQAIPTHQLLFNDRGVAPETLSALLGIDINLTKERIKNKQQHVHETKEEIRYRHLWIAIAILSFIVAFFAGMITMYFLKIGPFYVPQATYFDEVSVVE